MLQRVSASLSFLDGCLQALWKVICRHALPFQVHSKLTLPSAGSKLQARRRNVTFASSEGNDDNSNIKRLSGGSSNFFQLPSSELKPTYSSPLSKSAGQLEDLLTRSGLCMSQPASPFSGRSSTEVRQGSSRSQAVVGNFNSSGGGLPICNLDMGPTVDMRLSSMASRNS
eukprot:scaffold158391_cov18-Tisochrysis_lutea.AAC.1